MRKLTIVNWNKIMGCTFCDERYLASNFVDNEQYLEFWFKDLDDKHMHKGHWIRIQRDAKWDVQEQKWMYQIHRPDYKLHFVSSDWFADIDNARSSFEDVLKETI